MTTDETKSDKENAVNSVGWLFGGNYTPEQTDIMVDVINKFESLCYLERQHVIDILAYIHKNEVNNEEILTELETEYQKQQ